MTFLHLIIVVSSLVYANQSYAQSCYGLSQNSAAYQICMLRQENQKREIRDKEEREREDLHREREALHKRIIEVNAYNAKAQRERSERQSAPAPVIKGFYPPSEEPAGGRQRAQDESKSDTCDDVIWRNRLAQETQYIRALENKNVIYLRKLLDRCNDLLLKLAQPASQPILGQE